MNDSFIYPEKIKIKQDNNYYVARYVKILNHDDKSLKNVKIFDNKPLSGFILDKFRDTCYIYDPRGFYFKLNDNNFNDILNNSIIYNKEVLNKLVYVFSHGKANLVTYDSDIYKNSISSLNTSKDFGVNSYICSTKNNIEGIFRGSFYTTNFYSFKFNDEIKNKNKKITNSVERYCEYNFIPKNKRVWVIENKKCFYVVSPSTSSFVCFNDNKDYNYNNYVSIDDSNLCDYLTQKTYSQNSIEGKPVLSNDNFNFAFHYFYETKVSNNRIKKSLDEVDLDSQNFQKHMKEKLITVDRNNVIYMFLKITKEKHSYYLLISPGIEHYLSYIDKNSFYKTLFSNLFLSKNMISAFDSCFSIDELEKLIKNSYVSTPITNRFFSPIIERASLKDFSIDSLFILNLKIERT